MKNTATGFKRILTAFIYSYQGFCSVYKSEAAFRQDLLVCLCGFILCCFFAHTNTERALMILSLFLILLMELVNSAIEVIIDRISPERHPLSGRAKDIGSLLVLVAFINAICVFGCILLT